MKSWYTKSNCMFCHFRGNFVAIVWPIIKQFSNISMTIAIFWFISLSKICETNDKFVLISDCARSSKAQTPLTHRRRYYSFDKFIAPVTSSQDQITPNYFMNAPRICDECVVTFFLSRWEFLWRTYQHHNLRSKKKIHWWQWWQLFVLWPILLLLFAKVRWENSTR